MKAIVFGFAVSLVTYSSAFRQLHQRHALFNRRELRSVDSNALEYMLQPEYKRAENENALYNAGLLILQSTNRREEQRALKFFEAALEFNPMRDGTNFNIALIKDNMGEYADAIDFYERTIRVSKNPQILTAAYNNLVGLFMRLGMLEEAAKACNAAIELNPSDDNAWSNLGIIMREEQKEDLSRTCFEHALEVSQGTNVVALNNLGTLYQREGDIDRAEQYFKKACTLDPRDESSLYSLACLLKDKGKSRSAILLLEELINLNPNHSQAPFLLDSLIGATPRSAPSNYIADLFDHYSRNGYEQHMLEVLRYQVPSLIADAITQGIQSLPAHQDVLDRLNCGSVIDLGVGTGLCSKEIVNRGMCVTANFTGCDLSSSMAVQAQELLVGDKPLFSNVIVADCASYLTTVESDFCDLVVAGDVIVYIGDIAELFSQVSRVLRKGNAAGLFAFTVEAREDNSPQENFDNENLNVNEDYVLHKDLRYAHRKEYVNRVLDTNGMKILYCERAVLRYQDNLPVYGYVYLAAGSSLDYIVVE